MKNLLTLKEADIKKVITDYLILKKFYVMRLNSGQFVAGNEGKTRYIKGQDAGTPDLLVFRENPKTGLVQLYFIEVKIPGKYPTDTQIKKMKELQDYGATCIVARSLEDLEGKI